MSDIGMFSTGDLILLALIACSPGLVIGAGLGAFFSPGRRFRGAVVCGIAGFGLAFAVWWVYLTKIK